MRNPADQHDAEKRPESQPNPQIATPSWYFRYYVTRSGLKWHVRCGDGTRSLGAHWWKRAAQQAASELFTAFMDGKFVGEQPVNAPTQPKPDDKFKQWAEANALATTVDDSGYYSHIATYWAAKAFEAALIWVRSGPTSKCFRRMGEVDCDAPFCGCNPAWSDALQMLQECGWKSPEELRGAK